MSGSHTLGPITSINGFIGPMTLPDAFTATTVAASGAITGASVAVTGAVSGATVKAGSTGTPLTLVAKGTIAVTIGTNAAAAESDISLSIAAATIGDMVLLTPLDASMETGVGIIAAWVSVNGTVKVRVSNFNTGSLSGSTANWQYCLIRS